MLRRTRRLLATLAILTAILTTAALAWRPEPAAMDRLQQAAGATATAPARRLQAEDFARDYHQPAQERGEPQASPTAPLALPLDQPAATPPVGPAAAPAGSTPRSAPHAEPGRTADSFVAGEERITAGGVQRRWVVRRPAFKYPLIRVEERLDADGAVASRREVVADHLLVSLRPGTDRTALAAALRERGLTLRRSPPQAPFVLVSFPAEDPAAAEAVRARLADLEGVQALDDDPIIRISADELPDDPHFGLLWGLHNTGQDDPYGQTGTADADIDAPEAWRQTTGSRDVLAAVIDTGIDHDHPDLAANIWTNPYEIPGNGIDDDGNGFIDDVRGWNFNRDDNLPYDDQGHGTHCAGTIGALGDNGVGVAGVCWRVSLVGLKFRLYCKLADRYCWRN